MSDICLHIDYRFNTLSWHEWSVDDKEETDYSLNNAYALWTDYKIKNSIHKIYNTLLTDIHANENILFDTKNHVTIFGNCIISYDEDRIYIRSNFTKDEYKIYYQNHETGELELFKL